MDGFSVSEFARLVNRNETTIRRAVQSGKLRHTTIKVNNKKAYKIFDIPENFEIFGVQHEPKEVINDGHIEDVEIIDEPMNNQLVSMEQASFDALLDRIQNIANDRYEALKLSYEEHRAEVHELRAEVKKLEKELMDEKIKAAQAESAVKIKEVQFREFEDTKKLLEEKVNDLQNTIKPLEEELKNTKIALDDCQQQMQDVIVQKADLQGDLQDERETVQRVTKQCNAAIEEAQEFERKNQELEEKIKELQSKSWWQKFNEPTKL
jgi:chromosome segregation ATPase